MDKEKNVDDVNTVLESKMLGKDSNARIQTKSELASEVVADFKKRQEKRRPIELNWRLNMNFVAGNQFAEISPRGDIEEGGKQFYWQQKEVYNHIAPILETRLSKLARVKAQATVRPVTSDENDIAAAGMATKLIAAVCKSNEFSILLSAANTWCEITGSAFFKVQWDSERGKVLTNDKSVKEGDVSISVCPPFEIFPENLAIADIDEQASIMHVKVLGASDVLRLWGKRVEGKSLNVFSLDSGEILSGIGYSKTVPQSVSAEMANSVLVIEKYEAPTAEFENGRLIIVAGDELVYCGELPYMNGEDGKRGYPFSKQVCLESLGSFFGSTVVERIIPIQRAYNSVKNRKHEFMNRIATGILAVEDGSVDTDNLEEEGLCPGKILIYRQGSTPPIVLSPGQVPSEFSREEEKLLNEFVMVSGVSEVTTYSQVPSNVSSGTAISLLLEQDDTRISLTADSLREAVKRVGKFILRLYKQYALRPRLMRITGENGEVECAAFVSGNLNSEDIVFDTVNEIEDTLSSRRAMVYDLLKLGLFADEKGGMSARTKTKLFEILGFGTWEQSRDLDEAHQKKAIAENLSLEKFEATADIIDNHAIHIDEHTKLCVSPKCMNDKKLHDRVTRHIAGHREFLSLSANVAELEKKFEGENYER